MAGWCSALLEYLAVLINGEMRRVPLPRGPLNEALATTRLLFGTEAIEYRLPATTRVGAMLGIKEYPTPSVAGMYNRLLSAPFPLLLTQSFTFLTKATGAGTAAAAALPHGERRRLRGLAGGAAQDALDALTSNEFVMGDHHFTLQVLAEVDADGADVEQHGATADAQ